MNNKKVNLKYGVFVLMVLLSGISGFSQTPNPPPIPIDKKAAPGDWEWLSNTAIPTEQVTRTLKQIPQLPAKEAKKTASQLRTIWEKTSLEGKQAASLLIAAALEQAGEDRIALITYRKIKSESGETPYAKSADFRLRLIDDPELAEPEESESLYKNILKQGNGWFFVPEIKTWITPHEAAQHLIQLHSKKLSFRFFKYLWSKSPFTPAYSYLFILLVLTFSIKILEMPLYIKTVKYLRAMRDLLPTIENIRNTALSLSEAQQQTNALLRSRGVNPASGCAVFILDLIFMVWALYSMADFSPQFALDGAVFPWTPDILQRSAGVLIAWVILSTIQSMVTANTQLLVLPGGVFLNSLLGGAILAVIAWFTEWPAYVFIFWILLTAAGIILHSGIQISQRVREY